MTPREKENTLQQRVIDSIMFVATHNQPEGWLPMKVTVIEYPEDDEGTPQQRLAECILKEIFDCEECCMQEIGTDTDEPYGLSEIILKSLIEVWEQYTKVSTKVWRRNAIAYLKQHTSVAESVIEVFVDTQWDKEALLADNLDAFNTALSAQPEKEKWVFTFSIDRFDRDVADSVIIADYERGNSDEPTRKMTVGEFAALINDEMFDDVHNWVRVIELPK